MRNSEAVLLAALALGVPMAVHTTAYRVVAALALGLHLKDYPRWQMAPAYLVAVLTVAFAWPSSFNEKIFASALLALSALATYVTPVAKFPKPVSLEGVGDRF